MPELNLKIGKLGISTGFGGGRGIYFKAGLPMGTTIANGRYGGNGRSWFYNGLLPGAKVDYQRKAGDQWKNSIVSAGLGWIARNAPQAPPCVYRENADGEEEIVPKHPLTQVLKQPNKYYDGRTLRQATFLSLIAGRGNAYWWVKRDNIGRALEFWWLPHWEVWPLWDANTTTDNWIEGYAYRCNGITYTLKNEEVIHFREGLDPENMRSGLDPLRSTSREQATDNEAAGYAAQLLGNMCIPGAIISPVGDSTLEQPDADEIKSNFEETAGGENRFRPMVLSGEVKVEQIAWNPEEMSLTTIQDRPEARICAQIGIHPAVLGLTVGLEHSTYSNMEAAERAAWYNCILPRLALIESELDTQILTYYPDSEGCRVGNDHSKVLALQDNAKDLYAMMTAAVGGPWMQPNEARAKVGLKPADGADMLYPAATAVKPGGEPDGDEKQVKRMIMAGWKS